MAGGISVDCGTEVLQRRLLLRLERARTRLAVMIAIESKTTTAERWQKYGETDMRLRRCLKDLRTGRLTLRRDSDPWIWALQALDRLGEPIDDHACQSEAQMLCRRLAEILEVLEEH